jgi:Na+/proline symporter/nitrogen-specific signal transduction histidine kinase
MLQDWVILLVSLCYLGILFAIAYYGDKRADAGRSIISNPYIYTLSIAVYCTAWTFYGSVGRAAATGVGFLPIYLGPTLMAAVWWLALRKIIRIAKSQRITSIADFIASRYGKSMLAGGLVTVIAVVGIVPYIALQLKAVSSSFAVLNYYPDLEMLQQQKTTLWNDTAFSVAMVLAAFSILFGTRNIDATERHEGMVAAIAFESLIKLLAFSGVGIFVTFVMFSGPGDIFSWAKVYPDMAKLLRFNALPGGYANWFVLTFLSMMAILFLPRQFQVLVVENVNENHIRKAAWLFPLYLLAINLFVLPISLAGKLLFPEGLVDPDTFVLTLPMTEHREILALFIYLGGLSAATGMVIVATIALSTMVCNDLVLPVLLRLESLRQVNLRRVLLAIRRTSIVLILLLGYLYCRIIGESYPLVSIGLVSFAAAAQFAPAMLIGIYWKGASRKGAIIGLLAGFLLWVYTLVLPAFARSGWIPAAFLEHGPFGMEFFRPYQLFGLDMFDPITHSVFWTMLANTGLLVVVSLFDRQSAIERIQATLFVDVFNQVKDTRAWRGTALVRELRDLVARFEGQAAAKKAFTDYARRRGMKLNEAVEADASLVEFVERRISGSIGAASARVMVSSVVKGEAVSLEEVMQILNETSQVIEYSHRLEEKSKELEAATRELQEANTRLKEMDRLKDEFVSTVSHELRTPLTSVRAFSEILHDNPAMNPEERQRFLTIIVKEAERLTRLTNRVLDIAKIDSGKAEWLMERIMINEVVNEALDTVSQLSYEKTIKLGRNIPAEPVWVWADRDRILQVVINLVSNAVKFCEREKGLVLVRMVVGDKEVCVEVIDNGPGIPAQEQERIFEKFHQLGGLFKEKPGGSGLGLAICQRIIKYHSGRIWVDSSPGRGSTFAFSLPRPSPAEMRKAAAS